MQIEVKNLSYVYSPKTPFKKQALYDVSFSVEEGQSVGIVGATGSGKTTLIQHLNGLIKLKSGSIKVFDIDLTRKKPDYKTLRKGMGMLFQYPEYQLFADTVEKDIIFGPTNFGITGEDAVNEARKAAESVGLDYEAIKDRSPLELSGGQKRRVAMAGILACRPAILVLDEPTAGLDPSGKREMLDLITSLKKGKFLKTVITVSHNMDEIAEYNDRVLVLSEGKLLFDTTPEKLFYNEDVVKLGLTLPHVVRIVKMLKQRGFDIKNVLSKSALVAELTRILGGKK